MKTESQEKKIRIAGTVTRIVTILQSISSWMPFPLFTRTWRNYPEFFTERMRDELQVRSKSAGIKNAEEFQAAAYLGIKHGLIDTEYSDITIGGLGCEILLIPEDYCERVEQFVIDPKTRKFLLKESIQINFNTGR